MDMSCLLQLFLGVSVIFMFVGQGRAVRPATIAMVKCGTEYVRRAGKRRHCIISELDKVEVLLSMGALGFRCFTDPPPGCFI